MGVVELTSVQNDIVKEIVALSKNRKNSGLVILEGEKSIQGAIETGLGLESIFFVDEEYVHPAKVKYKVNQRILEKISSTKSAVPVLAITKEPVYSIEQFKKFKKIALFENIKDAGNLGTIIRSAAAFGLDGIILYGDCVDPFSTKVIRASAGTIFKMPIITLREGLGEFKNTHTFISTVVSGGDELVLKLPYVVLFGSEAEGLSLPLQKMSDKKVTIEMARNVESLNLSVSAGIIFHELFKMS